MFSGRWDYWFRTVEAGKVLDEPIPQINWLGHAHPDSKKNLETCINLCRDRFTREAFDLFVEWILHGLSDPSVEESPAQITPALNASWYKTFNLGLFLQHPYDYLGEFAAELYGNGGRNPTAYFPTPMNVSVMMAKMTFDDNEKGITASVCDPCLGSGRLLMAASNYSLNLYGMDIDRRILNVAKVNFWQYVPWAVYRPEIKGLDDRQNEKIKHQPVQQVTPEVQKQLIEYGDQMNLFGSPGGGKS